MTYLQAIIIAIVEGLTEFLPVSSTGHMVITSSLMGISSDDFTKMFEVVIQFGAILSVLVLYWRRFLQNFDFYVKLAVGFLPAAVFGVLFYKHVKALLESPTTIAIILLAGGVVLLFVDEWFSKNEANPQVQDQEITYKKALIVGCFQVLAMILPGLSRSAATIIGGLTQKLTRQKAAEFSFFLAVPTMAAATLKDGYEFWKGVKLGEIAPLSTSQWGILAVGNIVAFMVAMIAIRTFIGFLTQHGFKVFGYYRIVVGLLILILQAIGFELFVG
ncbi:MAG: undecaprenyl-diphosphate phosphatase [Saprospiraceae bacterium]|nr:undecaprenyl-diphosphate phosphatase [Saprospiraceae bacterium]